MPNKRGFSFIYVLVFAIVSVSSAIVILLAYSIVSDIPINELVPDSVGNLIGSTNSNNQNNNEGFLGGFLGGLFGGNKKSSGGGSGGSGGGGGTSSGTGGNPSDGNNTNQTYLACVNNTCAIVNGSGTDQCLSVGVACNLVQCNDGLDNDLDYWADVLDPGCTFIGDDNESNPSTGRQCSDGVDNVPVDGFIDGNDTDCSSWNDDSEGSEPIVGGNAEYITPGNGWNNQLTDTPSANGIGPTPIGRWDFVPYQTINNGEEIGIGVVAFHIYGIEKVLFSVENGSWEQVNEMSYNPHSRVWEYWIKMKASDFSNDGLKEIRAIIYPQIGQPRVLQGNYLTSNANGIHSMFLNTNNNGNLLTHLRWVDAVSGDDVTGTGTQANPFKTIVNAAQSIMVQQGSVDGGIIYLRAGKYYWGTTGTLPVIDNPQRWLTVSAAPGVARESVIINDSSGAGLKTDLVHLYGMLVNDTAVGTAGNAFVWADHMLLTGGNLSKDFNILPGNYWDAVYSTDSDFRHLRRGILGHEIARHDRAIDIVGDMVKTPRLIINFTGEDLWDFRPDLSSTPNGTLPADVHRDVIQGQSPLNNTIVYGFMAVKNISGQNFFFSCGNSGVYCTSQDIAFVNYIVDSKSQNPAKYGVTTNHLLLWNFVEIKRFLLTNHKDIYPTWPDTHFDYLDIRNSVFESMGVGGNLTFDSNIWAVNNHFIGDPSRGAGYNTLYGVNYTNGSTLSTLFVKYTDWNSTDNDFHPSINSILRSTNRPYPVQKLVPVDVEGNLIPGDESGAIGSLQYRVF